MRSLLTLHLRQAIRGLRRNPTFTIAVLLTLALAIGANTAVFSVVNGVLINPLPYPEPESLISVLTRAPGAPNAPGQSGGIPDMPESASMYVTYSENNRSFQSLGVFQPSALTVDGANGSEQIRAVSASRGVLEALRVQPMLGRIFADADYHAGGPDVVILGWGYWQRRFGGDPSIVGRTLTRLGGDGSGIGPTATSGSRPLKVVGVMPRGFRVVTIEPEVIVPLWFDRNTLTLVFFQYEMVGRLKPGVTLAQADADLGRLVYLWGGAWPMPPGYGRGPRPFDSWHFSSIARPLKDGIVAGVSNVLWILMATIGIVMLIACANVANLVLVRAEGRQQEFAVRTALGAGRGRLIGEWLLESIFLGLLGGAIGTAIAYAGVRLLKAIGPQTLPRLEEITINARVLAFAVLVSILSGVMFGLIPAFKYAGRRLSGMLAGRGTSDSRERLRTRNGLVVAQVALALVLLVSSGLMIRTFLALRAVVPGFDTAQLQTIGIAIPTSAAATADQTAQIQKSMLDELRTIPGVTMVALTNAMPMGELAPNGFGSSRMPLFSERDSSEVARNRQLRMFKYVSPDYFRTSGTRVIAGREYTWSDLEGLRPVAIVSKNLAIEQWGSPEAALGQRVRPDPNASWREVIGVVEDVRESGANLASPPIAYWPSRVESLSGAASAASAEVPRRVVLMVRSPRAGSPALIDAIRQRLSSVNGSVPVSLVLTMQDVYDASMTRTSFALVMLVIAASMALVLGLVGIYGVVAYVATRRTREVGIRLTLGAQQREVRGMFLRHGLALTCIGIVIGLGAAAGVTRVMTSLLFDVSPVDPLTYVAVALVLMMATLLASYVPARRISRVDPAVAMRAE
jgi:putative ABC transport system permease protein